MPVGEIIRIDIIDINRSSSTLRIADVELTLTVQMLVCQCRDDVSALHVEVPQSYVMLHQAIVTPDFQQLVYYHLVASNRLIRLRSVPFRDSGQSIFTSAIRADTRHCQLNLRTTIKRRHTPTFSWRFIIPDNDVYDYRPFFSLQLSPDALHSEAQTRFQYPRQLAKRELATRGNEKRNNGIANRIPIRMLTRSVNKSEL